MLCGCLLLHSVEKRYKKLQDLAVLLQSMCVPTPYVYQRVVDSAAEEVRLSLKTGRQGQRRQVACCIACINWIRRLDIACVSSGRSSGRGKLPIPALLLLPEEVDNAEDEGNGVSAGRSSGRGEVPIPALLLPEEVDNAEDEGNESDCSSRGSLIINEDEDEETAITEEWILAQISIAEDAGAASALMKKPQLCTPCAVESMHNAGRKRQCIGGHNSSGRTSSSGGGRVSKNLLVVPLDNLLLFLDNPGAVATGGMHPDRRSMYRLMCGLCMPHRTRLQQKQREHETRY